MSRSHWPLAALVGMSFAACAFLLGCEDESAGKTANEPRAAKSKVSGNDMAQQNQKAGEEFLAANAKKEGVKTTSSGLHRAQGRPGQKASAGR
jgi:FKBP-type peptidyl-prolyl cis-trans isomerase